MATSTAHRAPPPAETPRSEKAFSLQGRLDAALAPEATASECDALLYAISRPLLPEADPREHADFLLSVLADERSRTLTGSNGRTVKRAAIQALLALGYPYALEIPPEAIGQSAPARLWDDRVRLGKALIVGNASVPAAVFTLLILVSGSAGDMPLIPISLLALMACTVLPMVLILKGRKRKNWVLQVLGSAGLILSGVAVGGLSLEMFFKVLAREPYNWRDLVGLGIFGGGLIFSATQLAATFLLHSPEREE